MHIHILGICGTFMGSLAIIARQLGHDVSGSDQNVYPPMSTQLESAGIELMQGYKPEHLSGADLTIVGNAMSRGNPAVEYLLNNNLPYISGPQWLADYALKGRWVLAVAGTHGKTTTSSMLAWILEYAGLAPGFLIGGVPRNFDISARIGKTAFFVVEADEYDTAFFDKRSKFVHYHGRTVILNNLEFDHADIFDDLSAIKRQFHHLVRTIPGEGLIVAPANDDNIDSTLAMGCWTPVEVFGRSVNNAVQAGQWLGETITADASRFQVSFEGEVAGVVEWSHTGIHNMKNALAAIAAARHVGVPVGQSIQALGQFEGVKRRMEHLGEVAGVNIYDDFAHHPTAIATTLEGLRKQVGAARIFAVIEPRSNTMRMGVHRDNLAPACAQATEVFWYQPGSSDWDLQDVIDESPVPARMFGSVNDIIETLGAETEPGDYVVIMSNGGFEGIHQKLLDKLRHAEKK